MEILKNINNSRINHYLISTEIINQSELEQITNYEHPIGERASIHISNWPKFLSYYEEKNKSKSLNDKLIKFLALTTIDLKYDQNIIYLKGFGYVFNYDDGTFRNGWNRFITLGHNLEEALINMFLYQRYWNAESELVTFRKEIFEELAKKFINFNIFQNNIIEAIDIIKTFGTIAYYYNYVEKKDIPDNILTLYNNELNDYLSNDDYKLELNKRYSNNSLPVIIYKKIKHKVKIR